MALITCPECGKEISDKAKACVNCGMPMENILTTKERNDLFYKVLFEKFISNSMHKKFGLKAHIFIEKIYENYEPQAKSVNCNNRCVLFDGITKQSADMVADYLKPKGCRIVIEESDLTEINELDEKIKQVYKDLQTLKCPRCHSTSITTGQKGFSFVTGFLGSNKTVNRCGKCGYSWQPK